MAKVDTDAHAQAVQALLGGLGFKRKQELIEKNDRLRFQFLQTQKVSVAKARETQVNAFLASVVDADKKVRELAFGAWLKENAQALGEIPDLPEVFKDGGDGEADEAAVKDATATLKKWVKTAGHDTVNVYARLGPYEFPAKVLTAAKKPKPKEVTGEDAPAEAAAPVQNDAAIARLRAEHAAEVAKLEARLAKQEEELNKFKRLLEENKDKRKAELNEAAERHRAELTAKQADWQRQEVTLRRDLTNLQKSIQDQSEKTVKVRDELLPLRQQLEKAEREARRAQQHVQEGAARTETLEAENKKLGDRLKALESAQQQLVGKEKQLQRFEKRGAAVALTSSDNLKIWEEALNEQEVKEAFTRTFNLDTIAVSHYEHDERDLSEVWQQLLEAERDLVVRFFAIPFDELEHPSDEFKDLITAFIELKDSLVAREQLAHLVNFVGNRFLQGLKQKV